MIRALINDRIFSTERTPGKPPRTPNQCPIVEKVAPVSVASHAGVQAKDLLVEVDNQPALNFDLDQLIDTKTRHQYRFFRPFAEEWLALTTTGAPLGIELGLSTPALVGRANSLASEWSDLTTLWERRDWRALERAARRTQEPRLYIRFVAFFLRQSFKRSPAMLMLGAALYEQGQYARAMPMIRDYYENLEDNWTMGFMAVARYYLGLDALERDDKETALHYLQEAYEYWELESIALRIEEITRASFPRAKSKWEGKSFPCAYALPREDGRGTVSLAASLKKIEAHQVLVMCLLGMYRVNGPYHEFLKRYIRLARHFADILPELHVISERRQKDARKTKEGREYLAAWIGMEDKAHEAGVPFVVLHDEAEEIGSAIDSPGSPHILALNSHGVVLHEGHMGDVDFWKLLAKLVPA
jgi:hypothetical protein